MNMKTNKKRNLKRAGLVAGILCLASVGGVSAYLTDFNKADNQFTVGRVAITVEEPGFDPEEQTKIEPGKEISKDPKIKNTGVNDAFVYLEVSIPMANVEAAAEDGSRIGAKNQELFSFQPSESWTKLSSKTSGNNQIYVYAYNKILPAEETTEALFSSVKFLNVIEKQIDEQQLSIPVRAYAIQASYTGGESGSVIDKAKIAYEKYVNQNKGQDGQVTP
ncbi:MAG: TasA family protein [Eubacteriales bacterium]|nr:TasA family protein [Eubacteriales bacterium]